MHVSHRPLPRQVCDHDVSCLVEGHPIKGCPYQENDRTRESIAKETLHT